MEEWLRWLRWIALIGALVLVGVLLYRATLREGAATRGDTRFYQRGAQRFWEGQPLYVFEGPGTADLPPAHRPATAYTYLPPFAAALGWARGIPYPALRGLWLVLSVLALWGAVRVARRLGGLGSEAHGPAPPDQVCGRPWIWLAVTGVLLGRFLVNDLAHGQVNALLALLLGLGLCEVYGERPWRGGVWIGLALVIKPTSWLLLPWLAVDRRWRAVAAACAAGLAALVVAGVLYPGDYLLQVREWLELMPRFADAESLRPYNASLASTFERLLVGSSASGASAPQPLLLQLDAGLARPLARGLAGGVVLVGLGVAIWLRKQGRVSAPRAAASVLALSALLSPITWKAHLAVLLAPVAFVAWDLASGRASRRRIGLIALSAALVLLPSRGLGALGSGLEAWGALSAVLVAIFSLCVVPPSPEPSAED